MFTANEQLIIFLLLMAIFAHQGYRRGLVAEAAKLGLILLGVAVTRPAILGNTLVKAVNGIYFTFLFLSNGGLGVILSGSFGPDDLTNVFTKIADKPLLLTQANSRITLFLLMLLLIYIAYLLGSRLPRVAPALGLVAGAANGLLLAYLFLPALPRGLPILDVAGRLDLGEGVWETVDGTLGSIKPEIVTAPVSVMYSLLGNTLITLIILFIVLLALNGLRASRRS